MKKIQLRLWEPVQAHKAFKGAWRFAKPLLIGGSRLLLEVKPATRTSDQNAKLHACLADVAKQVKWQGKLMDVEDWKRLMTAAWCRANQEGVEMVPAIDGQGFDVLYQRTSKLSRAECADLIEYVIAWGAMHGVKFTEVYDEPYR